MPGYTYGDGSGVNFPALVNPFGYTGAGSVNVETQGSILADEGGWIGSIGNIFSDVVGAVTQGYEAVSQFELAKYQLQYGTPNEVRTTPVNTAVPGVGYSSGFAGLDPQLLLIGGAAVVLVLLLRK